MLTYRLDGEKGGGYNIPIGRGVAMEDMPVFKSFLREQLENQKELEKAIKEKDFEKAEELIAKMIDRTQKGIEDN